MYTDSDTYDSHIVEDDLEYHPQEPCERCSFLCAALPRSMDVLSMIKHSISSDDPNPITRYFDIQQHVGSCGPEMIWKIFHAVRIDDNKEVSIFFFEKKIADKLHKPRRREIVSEILRREVQWLEKLQHPKILSIVHPLEECQSGMRAVGWEHAKGNLTIRIHPYPELQISNSLAFATEPVRASLANLLGNHERMPMPIPLDIRDNQFLELEIKYGILQVTEALSYLHSTEQIIHRNVCPQSILVTKNGNWKLAGLGFAEHVKEGKDMFPCQPWSNKNSKIAQMNLNYMAPEVQSEKKCSTVSDIFSLGVMICCVYNSGVPPISADHNTQLYTKQLEQLTQQFGEIAHKMPMPLVEPVEKMINKDTRYRPTAQLFSLLKYFHDPVVSCIQRLDTIDQFEPAQQVEVYMNLVQVIPKIPKKVLYGSTFPHLLEACQCMETMLMALPPLLALIDSLSASDYADCVMPQFMLILTGPKPLQGTVYLLDKLDVVLAKTPKEDIKTEIIPFVFNTLDSNCIQAQEAALGCIKILKEYLDDGIMRTIVLPRAKSLFNKSDNIRMRSNALTCIDNLLDSLDKMMILDEVLPFLTDISCQDAKIVMAVVGIYKHLLSDKKFGLTHNLIATKVMPPLIPQTVNPGLTMEQFGALMEVLRDMLAHIDRQRRDKMRQETVSAPIPQRGLINMQADGPTKDSRNYLCVDDAVHLQKSRTEYSFTSLPMLESRFTNNAVDPAPIKLSIRRVPATPESHPRNSKQKSMATNMSGGSLDECLSPPQSVDIHRRLSLAPPGAPAISLPAESPSAERKRRPSAQSLGPFSYSVSLFGDSRRSSLFSTDTRRSSDRLRRPSTHSVGILPIAMFGETERPRKPSTHSLGILPFGWSNDEEYDEAPRRASAHTLGPFWGADPERRSSRGSIFGSLGIGDGNQPQRRASFQALGESVMQLFSTK